MPAERRLPSWLKVKAPGGQKYLEIKGVMREGGLNTVCEEAHCPNIGDCWERGTATFMILGDICTRACAYCAVTSGKPKPPDLAEPGRVGQPVVVGEGEVRAERGDGWLLGAHGWAPRVVCRGSPGPATLSRIPAPDQPFPRRERTTPVTIRW